MQDEDQRTSLEKRIQRSFEDESAAGKPLSRRARQTRRTLEAYLKGGVLPRYMERLREIETAIAEQRRRLERAYVAMQEEAGGDADQFARRWRAHARAQAPRFADLNELIRQHNEWYPIERNLPLDPRTRDYVRPAGRNYRRHALTPEWVLEEFPPMLRADENAA
jgi:hypothetical protein